MTFQSLLPASAGTPLEMALEQTGDLYSRFYDPVSDLRGIKLNSPPPSLLPWLVYEYGLGELTPYVPNLYDLIREGIAWQRVRGTHASVAMALAWLDYAAGIENPPPRRRRWNLFQLGLNRVRDSEDDLSRIEGVAQLSAPVRSYFWRGYSGYDVRAMEYSRSRWSGSIYSAHSGVRIGGQAKWSYGRRYEIDHTLTQAELTALGVWTPPIEDTLLTWGAFPWPAAPWASSAALARSADMLDNAAIGMAWAEFRDAAGDVIGYRRCRGPHRVDIVPSGGRWQLSGLHLDLDDSSPTRLYVEALTGFGDGYGSHAASVGFILDGTPATGLPSGRLWLEPGQLDFTVPVIGITEIDIPFGRTVRERVCALFRF